MKRFVHIVRGWLSPGPTIKPVAPAPSQVKWTHGDRDKMASFLGSDFGQHMMECSRAAHYRMLQAASEDHFHAAQNAHCARGFAECLNWLQLLSVRADVPAQTMNSEPPKGEAESAESQLEEILAALSPR